MIDAERAASCDGKDPFDSPQQAWAVLAKSKSARQVYRCRFCGKFHIAG